MIEEAEFMRAELRLPSLVKSDSVVVNITRRSTNSAIEGSGLELIRSGFDGMVAPSIVPFTPRVMEPSAMKMSLRQYRDSVGQKEKVLSSAVTAYELLADYLLSRSAELSGAA
jgi:hypothetical protein